MTIQDLLKDLESNADYLAIIFIVVGVIYVSLADKASSAKHTAKSIKTKISKHKNKQSENKEQ